MAEFLDDSSGDVPPVVDRIPGLVAERGTDFGAFLNRFSKFLLDETAVKQGLEKINLKMLALVAGRQAQFNRDNPDFPVPPDEMVTPENLATTLAQLKIYRGDLDGFMDHVLSDVLTEIENDHGFGVPGTRKRAVTLSGLVGNDLFRGELIGKGLTWKDPSVNPTHGEFTHRLQWCAGMLELTAAVPKEYWLEAFKKIGGFVDQDNFIDPWNGIGFGLWDALVDRNPFGVVYNKKFTPYDTQTAADLRSPENLQAWLVKADHLQPASSIRILATFIKARQEKRVKFGGAEYLSASMSLPGTAGSKKKWESWAHVLFPDKNFTFLDELSANEKATIARAWYRLSQLEKGQPRNPIMVILNIDKAANADPALKAAYQSLGLNDDGSPK
ncbi:MAG: LirA/MavJ family T4SS effector [Blastocatellia bacterium]